MNDMGILALIPRNVWIGFAATVCIIAGLSWGVMVIRSDATTECEDRHRLLAAAQAEEAHQQYLAGVEAGNRLSAKLAETQRRLDETRSEYLKYANAITGVCDPSVRVLVEYASGAKTGLPTTPDPSTPATPAESAADLAYQAEVTRAIGVNVAENYSRLDKCLAEFNAVIDWHVRPKEIVK
jgi:hypothetical protein